MGSPISVSVHITLGLRDVLHDLAGLGYRATWGIFSAAEVGAPHQRKRVFILAVANLPSEGLERYSRHFSGQGAAQRGSTGDERDIAVGGVCGAWPSRPGEPQHGWEPSRVLAEGRSGYNSSQIEPAPMTRRSPRSIPPYPAQRET